MAGLSVLMSIVQEAAFLDPCIWSPLTNPIYGPVKKSRRKTTRSTALASAGCSRRRRRAATGRHQANASNVSRQSHRAVYTVRPRVDILATQQPLRRIIFSLCRSAWAPTGVSRAFHGLRHSSRLQTAGHPATIKCPERSQENPGSSAALRLGMRHEA
jgi:hypothetical protein